MAYNPQNPNGQTTSANSSPVVISSDQSDLPSLLKLVRADGLVITGTSTENNSVSVGNSNRKFKDGFGSGILDPAIWSVSWENQGSGSAIFGGNAAGSTYLRVTLDPYSGSSQFIMTSVEKFKLPMRMVYGLTLSQRIAGQETTVELVGCDDNGNIETIPTVNNIAISGTVSVTTNVATINTATAHGLRGGDRICLINNTENRLNVGPVTVTPLTATQFTVPLTLANGTYTAGGSIFWADPFLYASNAAGLQIGDNTTATNASFNTRRNGSSARLLNSTIATTAPTQTNTSSYTDAWNSSSDTELLLTQEEIEYITRVNDSISLSVSGAKYTQTTPDELKFYKLRIRFRQLPNFSNIVANIQTIQKAGTTTATVTTTAPHGLVSGQFVQIYGVRDQTNFPNLTTTTTITVTGPTTFTILIGTASSTSSVGGVVCINNGSVLLPGATNLSIQSISRTNNILSVTGNTTISGVLPGEYCQLAGMDAGSAYNGKYKVLRLSTTILELESVGPDFTSINTGGAIIKLTDFRMHYVRSMEYTRHVTEIWNASGMADNKAVPVVIGAGTVTTVSTVSTVTTVSTLTSLSQIATVPAGDFIYNTEHNVWANALRGRIT